VATPPNKVRPLRLGTREGAEEKTPSDELSSATVPPTAHSERNRLAAGCAG
jgi:hypothetical protein